MLEISKINVSYDGSRILKDVSISIPSQGVVCLMGRNGVGKTTTLKSIMGLVKTTKGEISFGGEKITAWTPHQRSRAGIGYVPQGRDIFPNLTVEENLLLSISTTERKGDWNLTRVYELFPVLKEMLKRKGGLLSGGQQQQLAIGRALLTDPKVLLLDEPTEGIQPSIIDQIGDTLKKIKADGKIAILLVEQYLDFALDVADYYYIMDRGSVVANGEIKSLTESAVKEYLTV